MKHFTKFVHTPRSLLASSNFFGQSLDILRYFTSLQELDLDFSCDGLSTQASRVLHIFNNISADLSMLKLTYLPRIDASLLALIAFRFPSLTTLELSCTERLDKTCCWLCFEESGSCTVHSPIPDVYPSVKNLAVSIHYNLTSSTENLTTGSAGRLRPRSFSSAATATSVPGYLSFGRGRLLRPL